MGHPHPRDLDAAWFRGGRYLHWHCDDQQQQEEGSQGQGGCEEEDLKLLDGIRGTVTARNCLYQHLPDSAPQGDTFNRPMSNPNPHFLSVL